MAFKKFSPSKQAHSRRLGPVTITVTGNRVKPFLSLDDETVSKLKWSKGVSLMLSIGEGDDQGKIRIEPVEGEPTTLATLPGKSDRFYRVRLGDMPCLTEAPVRIVATFAVDGKALVVTLPDAARSHQLPRGTAAAVALASGKK